MRQDGASNLLEIGKGLPLFQRTLVVNPSTRSAFSASLFHSFDQPDACRMMVRTVVFDPHSVNALCRKYGLPYDEDGYYLSDFDVVAESAEEVLELIIACHADWLDAYLCFQSSSVCLYKDHDEYTTLYASSDDKVAAIISKMTDDGHDEVVGWKREPLV